MSKYLKNFLIFCVMLIPSSFACADGILVTLSPNEQIITQGQTPYFVISAKAIGKPLRIIKFSKRGDLKDSYAKIRVTQNGKDVDVPIGISDPGPTNDLDYEILKVGQSISFEHRGEPLSLAELLPGMYEDTLKFRSNWSAKSVNSNRVIFKVIPK